MTKVNEMNNTIIVSEDEAALLTGIFEVCEGNLTNEELQEKLNWSEEKRIMVGDGLMKKLGLIK